MTVGPRAPNGKSQRTVPSAGLIDTAFKRVLQQAPLGTAVRIEGPFGDLRLHRAARPAVLLAGGIGITPFRSILVEAIDGGSLPYRVVLFHANRRPEDAPFLEELKGVELWNPNFKFTRSSSCTEPPQARTGHGAQLRAAASRN